MESRAMRTEEEIEQAMRRHGSAVYVSRLRKRAAARMPKMWRKMCS